MNHVKTEDGTMDKIKIQLLYLPISNFIALFALHVLCNIKTAMKSIPTNPFLITGYQGPDKGPTISVTAKKKQLL